MRICQGLVARSDHFKVKNGFILLCRTSSLYVNLPTSGKTDCCDAQNVRVSATHLWVPSLFPFKFVIKQI
jgi:hypothetical protein